MLSRLDRRTTLRAGCSVRPRFVLAHLSFPRLMEIIGEHEEWASHEAYSSEKRPKDLKHKLAEPIEYEIRRADPDEDPSKGWPVAIRPKWSDVNLKDFDRLDFNKQNNHPIMKPIRGFPQLLFFDFLRIISEDSELPLATST